MCEDPPKVLLSLLPDTFDTKTAITTGKELQAVSERTVMNYLRELCRSGLLRKSKAGHYEKVIYDKSGQFQWIKEGNNTHLGMRFSPPHTVRVWGIVYLYSGHAKCRKVPTIFKSLFYFDHSSYGNISVKPSQSSVELLRLFASYTATFA